VQQITEQTPLTLVIQKRRLMLFSHLVRMGEPADDRILTAVPQSEWKRLAGGPHTSWLATVKNDLSYHNLSVEDATELALPHWTGQSGGYWQQVELCIVMVQTE